MQQIACNHLKRKQSGTAESAVLCYLKSSDLVQAEAEKLHTFITSQTSFLITHVWKAVVTTHLLSTFSERHDVLDSRGPFFDLASEFHCISWNGTAIKVKVFE